MSWKKINCDWYKRPVEGSLTTPTDAHVTLDAQCACPSPPDTIPLYIFSPLPLSPLQTLGGSKGWIWTHIFPCLGLLQPDRVILPILPSSNIE
jgi:hypothetical protein